MHTDEPRLRELLQLARHIWPCHALLDLVRLAHLQLLQNGLHLGVLEDGHHLCGKQGRYGWPARPKRLIGRGWPHLGAVPGILWRW